MGSTTLRQPLPVRISRRKKTLFAGALWACILLFVELGARVYIQGRGYSLDAIRENYRHRKSLRLESQWKTQAHDHPYLPYYPRVEPPDVEMRGLRLTSLDEPKPPDVYRIFCLGGSTTFFGYPRKLEAALEGDFSARGLRLEVVNAADISWTTADSLVNFALRCVPYEPDAIIVYHAANDAWPAFGKTYRPDYVHWRKRLDPNKPLLWDYLPRALDRSAAFVQLRAWAEGKTLTHTWANSMMHYVPDFEKDPYHGAASFERNMRSIIAMAQAHGAVPLLATQVVNVQVRRKRYLRSVREMNDITRSLAREVPGVFLVDAAAEIPGDYELMYDICHFWPERGGEDRLVALLAEGIRVNLDTWLTGHAPVNLASR